MVLLRRPGGALHDRRRARRPRPRAARHASPTSSLGLDRRPRARHRRPSAARGAGAAPAAREQRARLALEDALAPCPASTAPRQQVATMLAAGIQVPIAAGAWLLAWLGQHRDRATSTPSTPSGRPCASRRPTWITARITTARGGPRRRRGAGRPRSCSSARCCSGGSPSWFRVTPTTSPHFDPDRWRDARPAPGGLAAVRRRSARLPGPHPGHGAAHPPGHVGRRPRNLLSESVSHRPESGHLARHRAASPSRRRETPP